jgi:hypothetical protein
VTCESDNRRQAIPHLRLRALRAASPREPMTNIQTIPRTNGSSLPPPLVTAPDMRPRWVDVEEDFDTAAERIIRAHENDGEANDLPVIDLRTWGVVPLDGHFGLAPLAKHHPPAVLRSNAFNNLATRLGAPVEFIRDRLTAPLQLATMNYLLASSEQSVSATLRMRNDEVSALVSDRYAPLDPPELVSCIREALVQQGAIGEVRVRSVATGLTDVMRLVFPSAMTAVKVGDVTALGIDVSSSCFGRSAVHIRGILWRLRCTNGLRVAESQGAFSFRHVGDSQRLRAAVAEAIPSALVAARGTMAAWKAAVDIMVENVAAQIDAMRELTIVEKAMVEENVLAESGHRELPAHVPLYDLINAITMAAHEVVPARRLELEGLAGEILASRTRAAA